MRHTRIWLKRILSTVGDNTGCSRFTGIIYSFPRRCPYTLSFLNQDATFNYQPSGSNQFNIDIVQNQIPLNKMVSQKYFFMIQYLKTIFTVQYFNTCRAQI